MALTLNSSSLRNLILSASASIASLTSISGKSRKFSSRLINFIEPDEIGGFAKTKIYTEVNTNLVVGDRVFIINGNYDSNDKVKKDRYRAGNDGYRILKIDKCAITIDLDYNDALPWNETKFDEHIKVWSCFSDSEALYLSQVRVNSTSTEQYRFEIGLDNILYSNGTYSTIFGNVGVGFYVLNEPTPGTYSWFNMTNIYDINNINTYVSASQSGNVVVMGNDFTHINGSGNATDYKTSFVYEFDSPTATWKVNHTYREAIISKSNFRRGEFNGSWSDGVYGSYDNRINWKKNEKSLWQSGVAVNTNWISGDIQSLSDSIVQDSYYSTIDNGLAKQTTDKSNNRGNGYNYFLDCSIQSSVVTNGNFINAQLGKLSYTASAVPNYITGTTFSTDVTIKSGKIADSFIYNGNYSNVKVQSTNVLEGKFSNSSVLNSHISKSVLSNSKFKADSSIVITDISKFFYTTIDGKQTVRYKLYINETDIHKLSNLESFYLKGIKFDKDATFDKFENVFYLNKYNEEIKMFSGASMAGEINCVVKTAAENTVRDETTFAYFTFFGIGLVLPITTQVADIEKPSLDITMEYNFPGFIASITTAKQWYDWVLKFNRLDVIETPYIIDAEYESGYMDNSTWEYGNLINNYNYQVSQNANNQLDISVGSTQSLQINLKYSALNTSWLDNNFTPGDVIYLDNIVWIPVSSPDPMSATMSETTQAYSLNGAYTVTTMAFSGSTRVLYLDALDSEAITNLNTMYNTRLLIQTNYGFNSGFFYTYDATTNPSNISSYFGMNMPNFLSISKVKINKSTVQSGVFARTFFKNSTIANRNFNNFDTSLVRTNVDTLKVINFLFTSDVTDVDSQYYDAVNGTYFKQTRLGNNTNIKSGIFYNCVFDYPTFTSGIVYDSYWVKGTFTNGLIKQSMWNSGIFKNGIFADSTNQNATGDFEPIVWTWTTNPVNPVLYRSWMQSPYGYTWHNGTFENGEMYNSIWYNGDKLNGKIYNTYWYFGNHYNGEFGDTRFSIEKNSMLSGHWYNGVARNATLGSTWLDTFIWENGEFNDGIFQGNSPAPVYWIDTSYVSGNLGLFINDSTNVDNGVYGTGSKIFINKFSDSLNTSYNDAAVITGVQKTGTYSVVITDLPFGNSSVMESGAIFKNFAVWKNGNFNGGYFQGNAAFWMNGNFNNGYFGADGYSFDHAQIITQGELTYAPFDEVRHNFITNWHNGNFNNGVFDSSWADGSFNDGRFQGKVWKNGVFMKGTFTSNAATFSAVAGKTQFNNFFLNPTASFRGLWVNGTVIDDTRKLNKDKKLFTTLIRRKDEVKNNNKVLFENVKWINGTVDHSNAEFTNSMWMNGVWKNGTWTNGYFNPFVLRPLSLNYIYGTAGGLLPTPLSRTDYRVDTYLGSDGYSYKANNATMSTFEYGTQSCYWNNGIWNDGEFAYSCWENGLWKNGTMSGAFWKDGVWWYGFARNIVWKDGTWKNGNWYGSDYIVGSVSNGSGNIGTYSKETTELLLRAHQILNYVKIDTSATNTNLHLWNAFNTTGTYSTLNNTILNTPIVYGSGSIVGTVGPLPSYGSWTYSATVSGKGIRTKAGNGRFLGGVWENGVWNNGWRVDTTSIIGGVQYATASSYIELDDVTRCIQITRSRWQFTVTGATFGGLTAGDVVSISNVTSHDINERRKLIRGYYTIVSNPTSRSLTVEAMVNFPIHEIVKDSESHKIHVSKNIWLSGAFLNGKFTGIWNSGLFAGFPFLTVMDKTHWIDGSFEGGRFIATQTGTVSTSVIQKMKFKDMDVATTSTTHLYNSWMDINYDTKYVSNIFFDQIILDDSGNEYTRTNYQGLITSDILESVSNMRDSNSLTFRDYNLGYKYNTYVDFIDRASKFNRPNIYTYGWTVSNVYGTLSKALYQDVTNPSLVDGISEPALFIMDGYPNNTKPKGVSFSTDESNLAILTHDSILDSLEIGRYTMVEFDSYTWSGTAGIYGGDMYGNRVEFITIIILGFEVVIPIGPLENLYFNADIDGAYMYQHNPVRSNPDPTMKKMEYFYNRVDMDMYIGGSFSAVLDNLKFYEVDMIPFYKYTNATASNINYGLQIPYTAVAPYIDYTNQNFSFIDNVVLSTDSIVSAPGSGGGFNPIDVEIEIAVFIIPE
jgi:hypothetical protein